MYEQLLQPSLLRFFRTTALDSLPIHKGLAASSALFCEKISRKSGQSNLLVQVLKLSLRGVCGKLRLPGGGEAADDSPAGRIQTPRSESFNRVIVIPLENRCNERQDIFRITRRRTNVNTLCIDEDDNAVRRKIDRASTCFQVV
jgi:hypothetical protein